MSCQGFPRFKRTVTCKKTGLCGDKTASQSETSVTESQSYSADKRISKLCKARGKDKLKRPAAAAAATLLAELEGTGSDKDGGAKNPPAPAEALSKQWRAATLIVGLLPN